MDIVTSVNNYINVNIRAPSYIASSLGNIRFENLIYTFSKILTFYGSNGRLPSYCQWNSGPKKNLFNFTIRIDLFFLINLYNIQDYQKWILMLKKIENSEFIFQTYNDSLNLRTLSSFLARNWFSLSKNMLLHGQCGILSVPDGQMSFQILLGRACLPIPFS